MVRFYQLMIFLLLTCNSFAKSKVYALEVASLDGFFQQSIIAKDSKLKMVNNSNYFQVHKQEIGVFEVTNSEEIRKAIKELQSYHKKLKRLELRVGNKTQESKMRQKHRPYFWVEGNKVLDTDLYYEKIDKIFAKLNNKLKVKLVEGISYDYNKQKFYRLKAGKMTELNEEQYQCEFDGKGQVCVTKSYGTLFIR